MIKIIKNSQTTRFQKGFTLAETLIALVVIGVVAAITVPNMIIKHQKEETVIRLKKAYSAISQTTNKAISDHGQIKTWELESGKTKEFVDKYVAPYLNVSKNCGYKSTGACYFEKAQLNTPNNKQSYGDSYYKLILGDGTALLMYVSITNDVVNNTPVPRAAVTVYIDINGQKGPNIMGRDVFHYVYWVLNDYSIVGGRDYSGKLLPNGGTQVSSGVNRNNLISWSCNRNGGDGRHCAALIMADNWEIKDDYPW